MTLVQYLVESFDKVLTGKDWLDTLFKMKEWPEDLRDDVLDFVNYVYDGETPEFTHNGKVNDGVNIPRIYRTKILDYVQTHPNFFINNIDANKFKVCARVGKKQKVLFILGDGSVGKVPITTQEQGTVNVFNWLKDNDIDDLTDEVIVELTGIDKKPWIISYRNQMKAMLSMGLDPHIYTAVRYGDGVVGKAYDKYMRGYIAYLRKETDIRYDRNTLDPSDILLYKDENVVNQFPKDYNVLELAELIKSREFIGISLKQSLGKGEWRNLSELDIRVKQVSPIHEMKSGVRILVDFNIGTYILNLRGNFGDPRGLDRTDLTMEWIEKGAKAQTGKVPVQWWRSIMKLGNKPTLKEAMSGFEVFIKDHNNIIEAFKLGAKVNGNIPYIIIK